MNTTRSTSSGIGSDRARPQTSDEDIFEFQPEQILAGVVFHLIDEGLATRVDERSVGRVIAQLRRGWTGCHVTRGAWGCLSNRQRLNWLLERCGATVNIEIGGRAVLRSGKATGGGLLGLLGMGGLPS